MISREQAGALAALARTIRPSWDQLATLNAIAGLRDRSLPDAARAVVLAALDPEARTPKALTFDAYWPNATDPSDPAAVAVARDAEARARRLAENQARHQANLDCQLCDDRGYLPSGARCHHDPAAITRTHRGAELARTILAERSHP